MTDLKGVRNDEKRGFDLRLLVLCGVDDAGKSATIRHSTQYLGIDPKIVQEFLNQRNPRKHVIIDTTPVYIFCTSPQETAGNDASECRKVFKRRIEGKEPDALIIMPFNVEHKYEQGIEACLNEIDVQNLKDSTSFVFLDADLDATRTANNEARDKVQELRQRGYSVIGVIMRTRTTTKDEQGQQFSIYIRQQLA